MADVFISYCSADRARVGEIAHGLGKEGLSVWWDRSLIAGERYETEIDAALNAAKAVVVVWSPAAVASDWVSSEADGARTKGTLVPIMIQACRIPRPFDRLHTADLTNWKGARGNQGFPEMVEAVKAIVEGRAARAVPWKRRMTLAAIGSAAVATILVISALTGIVDAAVRWTTAGAFATRSAEQLSAGDAASPETQEGFRQALTELARSADLRTQRALTTLERGSRGGADRTPFPRIGPRPSD
ncbi:MAG: toll/interleukin-1 receptor domain-containing protein [Caulobacteraceae bacterium]|nr:toll/interleukin-1 receptor domain-containing protein [Caulobacteraceae bacterium]